MTVGLIFNGSEEIAKAGNYPKIRVFTASLIAIVSNKDGLIIIDKHSKWRGELN